jgi:hypothetical protein
MIDVNGSSNYLKKQQYKLGRSHGGYNMITRFIKKLSLQKVTLILTVILITTGYALSVSVYGESQQVEGGSPEKTRPVTEDSSRKARSGSIKGVLLDIETQRPLADAAVSLVGTSFTTLTNLEGNFVFDNMPVGSYSLLFTFPGMQPYLKTDIIVKSRRITFEQVEMRLIPVASEEVTVNAGYFNQAPEEAGSSTIAFSNEEIRRAPGAAGDINRIIASLPSIARVSDQANNLAIRGGSSAENLFIIDNIEIPNINHFPFMGTSGGAISMLNVDFIQDVNFYAGGFSAKYGDRLSSVMEITNREGNRERFNGQLSLDMSSAGTVVEGPLSSKGSWMFSARRSYLDLLTKILDAGAAVQYADFQAKMVYDFSPKNKITILGLGGLDKSKVTLEDAVDQGENTYGVVKDNSHTVGLNWFLMWSDSGYSNTSFSHTYSKYDINDLRSVDGSSWLKNLSSDEIWHLRSVSHYSFSHARHLTFGFELKSIQSKYNYFKAAHTDELGQPAAEVRKDISTAAVKFGGFAEYSFPLFSNLTLNFGIRADYFDYSKSLTFSPRASLVLEVSDKSTFSVSGGIFRQNLPLLLLYQDPGNRECKDPMTYQYSAGFSHLISPSTRFTVEAYYKDYRNFPVDPARPSLCLLDTVFGNSFYGANALVDTGRACSYGVEVVLQKKLKEKIYGMISGAWFRARYRDLDGTWHDRLYDNKYVFSVQGGYKPNRTWEFSIRWVIAGGLPYTPFDNEASTAAGMGIYDATRINEERLPAYHGLNLRADKRFHFSGSNLILYFSLWNAYNRKNVASYYWNEIENKPDYTYQFSTLPVLGVEYEF